MDSDLNRVLVLAVGLGTQVDPGHEHGDRPGGNVAVVWWQYDGVGANGVVEQGIRTSTRVGFRIEENDMQQWGCGGLPPWGWNGRHASRHTVCDRCRAVYHSWEDMLIPFVLGKSSIGVAPTTHPR